MTRAERFKQGLGGAYSCKYWDVCGCESNCTRCYERGSKICYDSKETIREARHAKSN